MVSFLSWGEVATQQSCAKGLVDTAGTDETRASDSQNRFVGLKVAEFFRSLNVADEAVAFSNVVSFGQAFKHLKPLGKSLQEHLTDLVDVCDCWSSEGTFMQTNKTLSEVGGVMSSIAENSTHRFHKITCLPGGVFIKSKLAILKAVADLDGKMKDQFQKAVDALRKTAPDVRCEGERDIEPVVVVNKRFLDEQKAAVDMVSFKLSSAGKAECEGMLEEASKYFKDTGIC